MRGKTLDFGTRAGILTKRIVTYYDAAECDMFIVETPEAGRLRKPCILMGVLFGLLGAFGLLFTMHVYVKPRPVRQGVPLFGFGLTRE
jgi:hypothetical protein